MNLKAFLFFSFLWCSLFSAELTVKTEQSWYGHVLDFAKVVFFLGSVSTVIFYMKNEKFKADVNRLLKEIGNKIANAESPLKNVSFDKK
jgi:hypothetical protein